MLDLEEVPSIDLRPETVLVRVLQVGVDGTDFEINDGMYGETPPDSD